ncbi:MAG TPA: arylsulfatase, partial [Chondromyces sp.]|nr:arylsulfatase [Chondromyces sp.]
RKALESTPWWPPRVVPPEQAPNVLLIITDDSGFGVPSTFGGVVPFEAMDRLAAEGLSYTNIHSTALCSPTRAALITGRNHHSAGFGVISEQSTGFPGYNSIISRDKATIGRILLDNGYATSWFGKNHNTPAFQASQAGPFDQWPTGMGFEYFYGFVGGDANQWQPNLFRNTTQIYPFEGKPGWNLVTGMADDAIDHLTRLNQIDPDKPFFVHYVPGATHAPHHPTQEWVDTIHDMHLFDEGYEKLRETIFENQKRLGVIPADTRLEPWPDDVLKPWDQLTDVEKKLFIKQVEIFAAYEAYVDHEIGRVIQAVEDMGKLDNTLVIYINGDNGTSAEGGPLGTPNEVAFFNGINMMPAEQQMHWYDVWGTEETYNHMSAGWSWAFDTPFTWFKQNASRLGGVRQCMAVSWPNGIKDTGGLREQFMHVVDVVPTILEVTGIAAPEFVDGIEQAPIEGTSFAYTFDAANAKAPTRHTTQYFEMMGQYALYQEGWLLATKVNRAPWEAYGAANPDPLNNQVLELYNLDEDFSQSNNIADQHPDKVKELKAMFIEEAKKYQVFPMDASVATRLVQPRPSITAGRTEFVYTRPMIGVPQGDSPSILNSSYTFTAEIEVPEGGAEGVIVASGGRFGGYGFYLLDSKPVFLWNMVDLKRIRWEGPALAPGKHTVVFDFKYDGLGAGTLAFNDMSGIGQGGTGTLKVDGTVVDTQKMEHTLPMILQWDESFDV